MPPANFDFTRKVILAGSAENPCYICTKPTGNKIGGVRVCKPCGVRHLNQPELETIPFDSPSPPSYENIRLEAPFFEPIQYATEW